MEVKNFYESCKRRVEEGVEKVKKDIEEKGGEAVAQDYLNTGKKSAAKAAFKVTKIATSKTAKVAGKTAVGTVTGTKSIVAAKIGKWLDNNYHVVIEHSGLGEREKKGAKYGIIAAHLIGKAKDNITKKLEGFRDGFEEKKKQFTLEESIPELHQAVGLIDKFSGEEGTIENRDYQMADGVKYNINKNSDRFEIVTTNPNGRKLTISYRMYKEPADSIRQEMQVLLDDLASRVEEYTDSDLVSFGRTTKNILVSQDKVYTSTFSKENHNLAFDYSLKEGGFFSKKCSYVYFSGQGIKTQEEIK